MSDPEPARDDATRRTVPVPGKVTPGLVLLAVGFVFLAGLVLGYVLGRTA